MFRRFFRRVGNWFRSKFSRRDSGNTPVLKPVTYNGEKLSVEFKSLKGFSEKEFKMLQDATELMINVINSIEFRDACLSYPMVETRGMNNKQIYDLFMSGKDMYNRDEDNDIDVAITIYYANNRTVGYTYGNTFHTWINRKFFLSGGYSTIAGNIVHEYMHNLGFVHPRTRRESVPYRYGDITGALVKRIMQGYTLTPLQKTQGDIDKE